MIAVLWIGLPEIGLPEIGLPRIGLLWISLQMPGRQGHGIG